MKRIHRSLFAAALAASLTGCLRDRAATVDAKDTGVTTIEPAPDQSIVTPPRSEQYRIVEVEVRRVADEMTANGAVAPDVSRTVPVNSMSGGRVVEIHTRLGDEVAKGQLLLRISSQDLSLAISDYRKALADELLSRRQLERSKLLFSRGAIAEKDVQTAEDTEAKAKVDVETGAQKIRLLGGEPGSLSPMIDVKAPSAGVIVEQNVAGGSGVRSLDSSPNLFTIADLSKVWVLCDVYENNLGQVRMGDSARIQLNAYPDRTLYGRVGNISRILDPATRTAKVRLELDNPSGLLRPGMFAVVTFRSQRMREMAVAPASAFLRLHDRDWVFVPLEGGRFRRVEVQAGAQAGDGTQEVLRGLRPGDRVVAQALQLASAND
ncbi:MAG: efflux RND transporter periplasmic adaptor subunit [Bryobacterales bacterium]|nr:efflux RND transporter periplasmic adaptor subunit [Bryobacterales bacterium]